MIHELLERYRNQRPRKYGGTMQEKCYPVSAVIEMLEEVQNQVKKLNIDDVSKSLIHECNFEEQLYPTLELKCKCGKKSF